MTFTTGTVKSFEGGKEKWPIRCSGPNLLPSCHLLPPQAWQDGKRWQEFPGVTSVMEGFGGKR